MLANKQIVKRTHVCIVCEDFLPMKQLQDIVWFCRRDVEESLVNDCDEIPRNYVASRHGTPVLDSTSKGVSCREESGCRYLGDSNVHYRESEGSEEDSTEEIEKSQHAPRRSERLGRTRVRVSDTVRMTVGNHVTYEKAMRRRMVKEWKVTLEEYLYSIERTTFELKLSCRQKRCRLV